jgi:hypothetical protein
MAVGVARILDSIFPEHSFFEPTGNTLPIIRRCGEQFVEAVLGVSTPSHFHALHLKRAVGRVAYPRRQPPSQSRSMK